LYNIGTEMTQARVATVEMATPKKANVRRLSASRMRAFIELSSSWFISIN